MVKHATKKLTSDQFMQLYRDSTSLVCLPNDVSIVVKARRDSSIFISRIAHREDLCLC